MFTATLIPGTYWASTDNVDDGKLNLTANPTITIIGALADLSDYSIVTPVTKTFTTFDLVNAILRVVAQVASTGQRVKVSSATTLPGGLSASYEYFLRVDGANPGTDFTLHYTSAGALANTDRVDITSAGTGTHTLTYFAYATGTAFIFDSAGVTWEKGIVSPESLPEYAGNSASVPSVRGAVPSAPPTTSTEYYLNIRGAWTQFPSPSDVGNNLYLNENVY